MATCILTLRLDDRSQEHFERLRQLHFPPERNQIPAHLTLFHQLPESQEVITALEGVAAGRPAFPVQVTGLRSLGKGVAFVLASPELMDVHRQLTDCFQQHLIAQDRQRFMPHIVVQNKATPAQARELLTVLQNNFRTSKVEARGFDLWRYLGGPWEHLRTFEFSGD